jgi:hypothetical protein
MSPPVFLFGGMNAPSLLKLWVGKRFGPDYTLGSQEKSAAGKWRKLLATLGNRRN